jgi:hypothetical protein
MPSVKSFTLITFLILLSLITCNSLQAQDTSRLRISLLTCTPGEELYSIFGHSAFRVIDSNSVTDHVFNYGTFNFDDEGFYLKFIRGKLLYYISVEEFQDFQFNYRETGRGITEQVLDLTGAEKTALRSALIENLKEENKYYKYDFFFDNCTTRLRDLILKYKSPQPMLPSVMPENTRFRQAIHEYLDKGKQYWSKLGIDILLGAPTDQVMTASQQQFLPDNLMHALDSSRNTLIVRSSSNLYELPAKSGGEPFFTPIALFWGLFALIVLLSVVKNPSLQTILRRFDGFLFFLTGLLGLVLILMWVATDHSMTKNNFNLLWAWPSHAFAAIFMNTKRNIPHRYFLITALSMAIVLLSWPFLPQQMNNDLIPLVLLLLYRSVSRFNLSNEG